MRRTSDSRPLDKCELLQSGAGRERETALTTALQSAIEELAPRKVLWGGCGTPYCNGWIVSVECHATEGVIVKSECQCMSSDGYDKLDDWLAAAKEVRGD